MRELRRPERMLLNEFLILCAQYLDMHLVRNRTMFLSIPAIGTSFCPWLGTRTCADKIEKPLN